MYLFESKICPQVFLILEVLRKKFVIDSTFMKALIQNLGKNKDETVFIKKKDLNKNSFISIIFEKTNKWSAT